MPKVSAVGRREVWFTESLGNREHGHVDQATVRIRIQIAQLAGGAPVASPQVINALRGRLNVVEQGNHDARVRMLSIQRALRPHLPPEVHTAHDVAAGSGWTGGDPNAEGTVHPHRQTGDRGIRACGGSNCAWRYDSGDQSLRAVFVDRTVRQTRKSLSEHLFGMGFRHLDRLPVQKWVPPGGLEPPTVGLKVRCGGCQTLPVPAVLRMEKVNRGCVDCAEMPPFARLLVPGIDWLSLSRRLSGGAAGNSRTPW